MTITVKIDNPDLEQRLKDPREHSRIIQRDYDKDNVDIV